VEEEGWELKARAVMAPLCRAILDKRPIAFAYDDLSLPPPPLMEDASQMLMVPSSIPPAMRPIWNRSAIGAGSGGPSDAGEAGGGFDIANSLGGLVGCYSEVE